LTRTQLIRIVKGDGGEPYRIANTDIGGDPKYYGFTGLGGAWYIMRKNGEEYRYTRGSTDYATNWTDRASLLYGLIEASI
jgi:hypothetical protein